MRALVLAACLLALGCDGDAFVSEQEDGAFKAPYDFSIPRPHPDLGAPDLSSED
ncbi:MAG TPA: hypothetical protein VFF06_01110 [Polyangia bacterium]|nr:hypothetical protein [Polyangia bacterium]